MAKYQPVSKTKYTAQTIFNFAFDQVFKVLRMVKHVYNPTTGAYQAEENPFPSVTKIDEASSTVTYVGIAAPGASSGDSVWQIKRLNTAGTVMTIEYADGDKSYDNEYDERTNLSYS